jgi:hypothetical protein
MRTINDTRVFDGGEGGQTTAEQAWEAGVKRARTHPPVQPEVGALTIAHLMLCPDFEIPFDLLNGIPKLGAIGRDFPREQVSTTK